MRTLALFMVLLSGLVLCAQDKETYPLEFDSIFYLEEISVVADKYKEVIPAQRLSGKELERMNTFSVADAIRFFSGVQLKDYGGVGGLKTIDVRSMGSLQTGVFYDGIQLGNAQNGQVDLGKFSIDNMEEISLYNGQKSDIFQTAKDFSSASSIYLRSRRPYFEADKRFNLKATFRTGSSALINPSLLYEHKINHNTSASLSAEYMNSSGKYRFYECRMLDKNTLAWDTAGTRQNSAIEAIRIEGGINGWIEQGKWHLKAYHYSSSRGIPGAIIQNMPEHNQHQWDRNIFVQGSFQKIVLPKYELMVNAKYAYDYLHFINPDSTTLLLDDRYYQRELYLSLANKYNIRNNWDLTFSVDHIRNFLDTEYKWSNLPDPSAQRHQTLLALASAIDIRRLKIQGSVFGNLSKDRQSKEWIKAFSPAFFIYYKPFGERFSIRGFYKRVFRLPTFNDLYYSESYIRPLQPEYASQYNLGCMFNQTDAKKPFFYSFQLDAYYNEITDKIVSYPTGSNLYSFLTRNIDKVEIRGLDFSSRFEYRMQTGLQLQVLLQYTYQKAQDFSDPEDTGDQGSWGGQLPYVPRHSGSAVGSAAYKGWNINYSFIYTGERYAATANTLENHRQPFYTSDLSLSKSFRINQIRWQATVEVNNLLDQKYDMILNYPLPGRNCRFTIRMEL